MSVEILSVSAYPPIQATMERLSRDGLGYGAWRVDGDDLMHVHSADGEIGELLIGRRGAVHRHPIPAWLTPKVIYRLWMASRA